MRKQIFSLDVLQFSVFLLQVHFYWGQNTLVVPSQPIIAPVGSDVTLPCQLDPVKDLRDMVVEWSRHDLTPRYIHIRRDGVDLLMDQNSLYLGRTSVSESRLQQGDMSLSLTRVRLSDGGTYKCYIPLINIKAEVTLLVVSVAPPSMSLIKERSGSPVLRCESRGWYPEPELEWLDSEGTVLLRTEAQRGASEELFSVSSRLSVEQRLGNTFTCRVRQQESGQSREAQLSITDDFLEPCPSCSLSWILFSLSLVLFLAAVAVLVVWKCKTKRKKSDSKSIELGAKEERESMMKKEEIESMMNKEERESMMKKEEIESMMKKEERESMMKKEEIESMMKKEERESMMKEEMINLLKQQDETQRLHLKENLEKIETELLYINDVINRLTVEKDVSMKLKEKPLEAIHNLKILIETEKKRLGPTLIKDKSNQQTQYIYAREEEKKVFEKMVEDLNKQIKTLEEVISVSLQRKGQWEAELQQMEKQNKHQETKTQQETREEEEKMNVQVNAHDQPQGDQAQNKQRNTDQDVDEICGRVNIMGLNDK
ncbi:butyrophilin subfamily 2 member A1-like [Periophthalmus magnuspinnatus]|uniref:butyrophilin subfamily 2 member A1-like n=1 Tax=Periophthalmus magnuspinnatus TaxID=409849 RepID=UPI002436D28C|nr:butyrophilin subfamily 2 member A1-like [Periophthalmus magnuspinnatus]